MRTHAERCHRCKGALPADVVVWIHRMVETLATGNTSTESFPLCETCASFVDAAIAGRPCFSQGEPER
jgi:hypothetical protein